MTRRRFWRWSGWTVGAVLLGRMALGSREANMATTETFEITKSEDEWRRLLSPEQFAVLR